MTELTKTTLKIAKGYVVTSRRTHKQVTMHFFPLAKKKGKRIEIKIEARELN